MTTLLGMKDEIQRISQQLFTEADRVFTEKGRVTEDVLFAYCICSTPELQRIRMISRARYFADSFQAVFPSSLLPALELLDKEAVTKVVSPSRSGIYQVVGASGRTYTCFQTSTYCSCPAYRFSVLHKEDQVMCKHHLAMRLSDITRKTKVIDLTDQQMAQLLAALE